MNPIFYGIKRAYHASLRLSHQALRPLGITPARLDMLRCIEKLEDAFQCEIADALGIRPSTTSRMLKSLLELELIHKERFDEYRRASIVTLSKKGEALLRLVEQSVAASGMADLTQNVAASWAHTKRRIVPHIERFYRHLRWVRFALGDTSIRFRESHVESFSERALRRPVALLNDNEIRSLELFALGTPS